MGAHPSQSAAASVVPSPAALRRLGLDALDELASPTGFAASETGTGLYGALFGRDSLWMLLLLLEADRVAGDGALGVRLQQAGPRMLRALAGLQGTRVDDEIEEQPGKILHEYRETLDERLRAYEMPFRDGRSYASFDATFLFLCAYAEYAARYPADPVVEEAWPAVVRALGWVEEYADADGDGLYEYAPRGARNPRNQVWKDSFDSASTISGFDVPPQPLAWIEVQGYAYRAFERIAPLLQAHGDPLGARRLRTRAEELRACVAERFWPPREEFPAMALDGRKRPLSDVASNAGHALWGGLLDGARADRLATRLRGPDLLTPWGLRCLSSTSPAFAPFAYHRGTVWPFDNAVVAAGLLGHGLVDDAVRLAAGVGAALLRLGTAAELYVVLDGDLLVEPRVPAATVLCHRRSERANRTQGFTAAAAVLFAALLRRAGGAEGPDA